MEIIDSFGHKIRSTNICRQNLKPLIARVAQHALELASYNFGIHEGAIFQKNTREAYGGLENKRGTVELCVNSPFVV